MNELNAVGPKRKVWRDDPIRTVDEDRLHRAPVAQRAARLIANNHSPESSVVYGLEGPWGSGKSSVITLISKYLTEPPSSGWQVVPFTPWATSGTEGLFSEFFASLCTVEPGANKKDLRGLITSYADIARPLASLIPFAGTAVGDLTAAAAKRLEKPWNVAFDEIAAALRELDTPVLVVVDDIDRLQSGELLDLLKVVRLLGRFPGVDFLLAYDEQTLVETLHNPGHGTATRTRARAFMEKIVQYPLSIPPLLTSQIVGMLNAGLTEIVTPERVETTFDKQRFGDVIWNAMPRQLATPRAIERFLAQVREAFLAHDLDEMNEVDLILATFLRVQFPDVFARLQTRKADLTRVASSYVGFNRREEELPDWSPLVEAVEQDHDRQDAMLVLGTIFPAIRENAPSSVRPGRFAHADYFDRYLAQAIPEGDIPDAMITRALARAAAGSEHDLRDLISHPDRDRAALALSKIRSRYPDVIQAQYHDGPVGPDTPELLGAAMALVDEAEDRMASLASTGDQLRYWATNLLRRLLHVCPNHEVDTALLRCTKVDRRAHVIATATRDLNGMGEEAREALSAALQREVGRVVPALMEDLQAGDDSAAEAGSIFLYNLVADSTGFRDLRDQIDSGLAAGDFSVEDVAARFVGYSYVIGGSTAPSRVSFSGELFTKITGIPARSVDFEAIDERTDAGWPGRRAFAARFIGPAAAEDPLADHDDREAQE